MRELGGHCTGPSRVAQVRQIDTVSPGAHVRETGAVSLAQERGVDAVSLRGVTKRFAGVTAVEDLTLDVPRGRLFGLLGPNGAGKTTVLRLIVNIYEPDRGSVRVLGERPGAAIRSRLGYLPEERGLYRKMAVLEQLIYFGRLKGLSRSGARRRAEQWLERMELTEWAGRKLADLSKGMQQKVQFACTVLHEPELLILDEPFSGLDPVNAELLAELIRELHAEGRTILLSTHRLEHAERLVSDICLIHRARAVLTGNLKRLKQESGRGRVLLDASGDLDALAAGEIVSSHRITAQGHEYTLREGISPQALLRHALELGEVRRFQLLEPTLHDLYVSLVRDGHPATEAVEPVGSVRLAVDR
jgi:ABC-2 type transport system ATP-binding protein